MLRRVVSETNRQCRHTRFKLECGHFRTVSRLMRRTEYNRVSVGTEMNCPHCGKEGKRGEEEKSEAK